MYKRQEHGGALGHVGAVHEQTGAVGDTGDDDQAADEQRELPAPLLPGGLGGAGRGRGDRLGQLGRRVRQRSVAGRGPERIGALARYDGDAAGDGVAGDVVRVAGAGARRALRGEDRGVVAEAAAGTGTARVGARAGSSGARRPAGAAQAVRCGRALSGRRSGPTGQAEAAEVSDRGRRQPAVAGGRAAGRARRALGADAVRGLPVQAVVLAAGGAGALVGAALAREVRLVEARPVGVARRTAGAGARPGAVAVAAQRAGRQRLGHVEGAGAATVAGRHGSPGRTGAGGAARGSGPGAAGCVHGADHATRTATPAARSRTGAGSARARGSRAAAARRTGGALARGGRRGTARQTGAVGGTAALSALALTRLAGREPVAGRLLLGGLRGLGRLRGSLGRARGCGGARRRGGPLARRRRLRAPGGLLAVSDGLAHDDRRDGPRPGDVDPDPGRQRRLGLALLRSRGRTARVRTGVGSRGCPVGRGARRVGGSAAPVGPGGRTVSFTTQGRFSRLAPPPVTPSAGGSAARTTILATSHAYPVTAGETHTGLARPRHGEAVRHLRSRTRPPSGCRTGARVAQITAMAIPPSRKR